MFFLEEEPPGFSDQEYSQEYNRDVSKSVRIPALFGLLAYNVYLVFDYLESPDQFATILMVRLALVTPLVLSLLSLLKREKYTRFTRVIVLVSALLIVLSIVYIDWIRNPQMLARDPIGIVFGVMYALCALRMRRRETIMYSLAVLGFMASILSYVGAAPSAWFSYLTAISFACLLGVGVSQIIENSWRNNFVQKKLIAHREAQAASLLEMVFPIKIAERLKQEKNSIAEYSGQVSVLFADIEGFTAASESLPPTQLVADLDTIFSRIDHLCALCGCEKIKTVGDAYLAVSGVPVASEDHASRVVRLALALHAESGNLSLGGRPVKFRIGIHSGPVVAGVIGKSRFSYDLWGDTVNTASRMESSAPSGSIQISSETAKLVASEFELVPRGLVEIKGKGHCKTWLVRGVKKISDKYSELMPDEIAS